MTSPMDRPMQHLTAAQAMAAGRARAAEVMPYFGAGVLSMVPREVPGHGTMSISTSSILSYDPDFARRMSANESAAVHLHEYLHIFLKHAERAKKLADLGMIVSLDDAKLWNQAADCEINDDLQAAGLKLPSGPNGESPCLPEAMGLEPNKLAEEYFSELKKRQQQNPPGGSGAKPQAQPQPNPRGKKPAPPPPLPQQPQAGGGWDGSGAGCPVPNEPEPDDADGRSAVDQEAQRKSDAQQVQQEAQRKQGNVPLGIMRAADAMMKPPKVPWSTKFARLARSAMAYKPGQVDYTRTKPSRRQGSFWGQSDAPILPSFRQPTATVTIVADTSGSMGEEQLQKMLSEVDAILKAVGGAVDFLACDAEVHAHLKVRDVRVAAKNMKGGGGTDFRPAFRRIEKAKRAPDLIVFMTDLYGTFPDQAPKKSSVIWLVLGNPEGSGPWGETIHIDEDGDE